MHACPAECIAKLLLACMLLLAGIGLCAAGSSQRAFAESGPLATGTTDIGNGTVQTQATSTSIAYAANVGGKWSWQSNGAVLNVGKGNQIKALYVKAKSSLGGGVQFKAYVNGAGWQATRANGKIAGQMGKNAKTIGAVRIVLTGKLSTAYDVRYQVKLANGKWQGWKKNGQVAGKAGAKLQAIRIQLVKKGSTSFASSGIIGVNYRVKVQNSKNWSYWKWSNSEAGKAGSGKRIQDLAISLDKGSYTGGIQYRVRLSNGNWGAWKRGGQSTGTFKNIEAVQIRLTGAISSDFDVVYRTYVHGIGWQARVRNGATAGTARGYKIESIKIQIVRKNQRSGWIGSGTNWSYYVNGKPVASKWIMTDESPMNVLAKGTHKYWIDATGKLAVQRTINPKTSRDAKAGSKLYATRWGYVALNDVVSENGKWYIADKKGNMKQVSYAEAQAERYVRWAIAIANDNSHGYSQDLDKRWGKPDYDCSSLVISAVRAIGLNAGGAVYTGNMRSELTKHGFVWHSGTKNLKRGDILLVHIEGGRQHTEIYIGNGKTVGAHGSETGGIYGLGGDQTGHEIDVGPYYDIWQGYLRFEAKG